MSVRTSGPHGERRHRGEWTLPGVASILAMALWAVSLTLFGLEELRPGPLQERSPQTYDAILDAIDELGPTLIGASDAVDQVTGVGALSPDEDLSPSAQAHYNTWLAPTHPLVTNLTGLIDECTTHFDLAQALVDPSQILVGHGPQIDAQSTPAILPLLSTQRIPALLVACSADLGEVIDLAQDCLAVDKAAAAIAKATEDLESARGILFAAIEDAHRVLENSQDRVSDEQVRSDLGAREEASRAVLEEARKCTQDDWLAIEELTLVVQQTTQGLSTQIEVVLHAMVDAPDQEEQFIAPPEEPHLPTPPPPPTPPTPPTPPEPALTILGRFINETVCGIRYRVSTDALPATLTVGLTGYPEWTDTITVTTPNERFGVHRWTSCPTTNPSDLWITLS